MPGLLESHALGTLETRTGCMQASPIEWLYHRVYVPAVPAGVQGG